MNWLVFLSSPRNAHGPVGMGGWVGTVLHDLGAAGTRSLCDSLNAERPPSSARGARGAAGGAAFSCAFGAVGTVFGMGEGALGALGGLIGRLSVGAFHTLEVGPLYTEGLIAKEPNAGT